MGEERQGLLPAGRDAGSRASSRITRAVRVIHYIRWHAVERFVCLAEIGGRLFVQLLTGFLFVKHPSYNNGSSQRTQEENHQKEEGS